MDLFYHNRSNYWIVLQHHGEEHLSYVSYLGLIQMCDVYPVEAVPEGKNVYVNPSAITLCGENASVFVHTDALLPFLNKIVPTLVHPIVLVTGCSDIEVKDTAVNRQIANSPMIKRWFAQNASIVHPKIVQIPIGIDYHYQNVAIAQKATRTFTPFRQEFLIKSIRRAAPAFQHRKCLAYCNYQFQKWPDRVDATQKLDKSLLVWQDSYEERFQSLAKMAECQFVISPLGRGLDCHRTWEAMALGCIPIVKTSALDPLHRQFPILILQDWSELTLEMMQTFARSMTSCVSKHSKMQMQYWHNLIRS